ncbi:hypothetical protein [Pseudomonas matsuisoli]|uniref:Uncharacterized protein n=1 Tax=Pseudomonas matsuisoli TaxID=1515666 RepID=A0A917PR31_9PSED|nr:hypothetical protein [Pseudomonas matsuisoli]GGJ88432.1 hypothetical protein GCM10009304_12670 [Pseudomonas matsuisoli]
MWHRKTLGNGAAVFQALRELRELRHSHDRQFGKPSHFIVAYEERTEELVLLLPPENCVFAEVYNATPCEEPDFESGEFVEFSIEVHPAQRPNRTVLADGSILESHIFDDPDLARLAQPHDQER